MVDIESQRHVAPSQGLVAVPEMAEQTRAPSHSPASSISRVRRVPVPPLIDFSSNPFNDDASVDPFNLGSDPFVANPFEDPTPAVVQAIVPQPQRIAAELSRLSKASSLMPPATEAGALPHRLSMASSFDGSYTPSEAGTIGCAM